MYKGKKIACVIPARLASTRFPQKVLATIQGKPILQWIWESASTMPFFDSVQFAVDAEATYALVQSFGGKAFYTDVRCSSGTDRLCQLHNEAKVAADIWVNWQGDEPFINQTLIEDLLQSIEQENTDVWTLKRKIDSAEDLVSQHIAKVVTDLQDRALYFSRSVIPYCFEGEPKPDYFQHIGIYAFTSNALKIITQLAPSKKEQAERLEQLRFLAHGLTIRVHETCQTTLGIDLPSHIALAEQLAANFSV